MRMTLGISLFLATAVLLLVSLHYYVWRRTVRDNGLSRGWRRVLSALLALACLLAPATFVLARRWPDATPRALVIAAFVWLGVVFYLAIFNGGWDAIRGVGWVVGRVMRRGGSPSQSWPDPLAPRGAELLGVESESQSEPPVSRRVFIARVAAGVSVMGSGGVAAAGAVAAREIHTPEVPVRLPRLPRALDGFRVAVLADLHLGPILDGRFTRGVVEKTNALRPDVVVIIGDLVDGPVERLAADVAPLADLSAPHGVFFVTGNHEFYSGVRPWLAYLPRLGMRVLANERVSIGDAGPGGASFDLAGTHDRTGLRMDPELAPNIDLAVAGRDVERGLVLLNHQPVQIADAVRVGAGLQISGHTHGGQIWPFGMLVRLSQPYISGLHQHTPETQIYVTRGTGFWGPPMRVLAPAEITTIILT